MKNILILTLVLLLGSQISASGNNTMLMMGDMLHSNKVEVNRTFDRTNDMVNKPLQIVPSKTDITPSLYPQTPTVIVVPVRSDYYNSPASTLNRLKYGY